MAQLPKSSRVVIVGGGIAGLGAADRLINHYGFTDVTVLESLGRLGGRIHPLPFEDGYIQLGAEYIHGRGNPVFDLATELDAFPPLRARKNLKRLTERYFAPGGCRIPEEDVDQIWEFYASTDEALDKLGKQVARIDDSIGQLFRAVFDEWKNRNGPWNENFEPLFDLLQRVVQSEHACPDWHRLSFRAWANWVELPREEELTLDKQGYKKILQHLEYLIPNGAVRLHTNVTHIDYRFSPLRLELGGERLIEADHVIVTVPLGHLKAYYSDMFTPALPQRKATAIETMGFGTVDKVFFVYEEPFWEPDVGEMNLVNASTNCEGSVNPIKRSSLQSIFSTLSVHPWFRGVLVAWVAGEGNTTLMEASSTVDLADAITSTLRIYLDRVDIPEPRQVFKSTWASQDQFRGSYSWYSVEADAAGVGYEEIAEPLLGENGVPAVLFAGEATHATQFQTTHGALLSGWREAKRLADPDPPPRKPGEPNRTLPPLPPMASSASMRKTPLRWVLDYMSSHPYESSSSSGDD